jgi:hypothetical protein
MQRARKSIIHGMTTALSGTRLLEVFASYNSAVWPVQPVLWALAIAVVALALEDIPWRSRAICVLLAVLWGWMAVAYQWMQVGAITPLGKAYAVLFLAQAALILVLGFRPQPMHFRPQGDLLGFAGSFMVACALMIHPVIAIRVGNGYPAFPTFGVPNPTVIFTIGVLLWAKPRAHEALFVIPTMWTIIALPSMASLKAMPDWLLPIATIFAGAFILWQKHLARMQKAPAQPENPAYKRSKGTVRLREAEARRAAIATQRAQRWSAQPMQPIGK